MWIRLSKRIHLSNALTNVGGLKGARFKYCSMVTPKCWKNCTCIHVCSRSFLPKEDTNMSKSFTMCWFIHVRLVSVYKHVLVCYLFCSRFWTGLFCYIKTCTLLALCLTRFTSSISSAYATEYYDQYVCYDLKT